MCPNCNEGNTLQNDNELRRILKKQCDQLERIASIENVLVAIQPLLQNIKPEMLSKPQILN